MKMSILDRIVVEKLYPPQGNMTEQIMIRDIRKKVEFSSKEVEKYKIRSVGERVT